MTFVIISLLISDHSRIYWLSFVSRIVFKLIIHVLYNFCSNYIHPTKTDRLIESSTFVKCEQFTGLFFYFLLPANIVRILLDYEYLRAIKKTIILLDINMDYAKAVALTTKSIATPNRIDEMICIMWCEWHFPDSIWISNELSDNFACATHNIPILAQMKDLFIEKKNFFFLVV